MACISLVAAVAFPSSSARLSSTAPPSFPVQSLSCRSRSSRWSIVTRAVPSSECATLEQCQAVIAEQLGIDASLVKPESKFSDLGADSLDTVEIVMQLEEKFKIQVEQEGAEKIVTVKDASDVIHKLVSQKQSN